MSLRRFSRLALGVAVLAIGAGSVLAQSGVDASGYRQDVPGVMTPAGQVDAAAVAAAFRPAYVRAGKPRIVVYWMRDLSDRVAPTTFSATHAETDVSLGGSTTTRGESVMRAAGYGRATVDAAGTTTGSISGGVIRHEVTVEGEVVDGDRDWLPAGESTAAEAAFSSTLMQAGAKVVDRAAITRLVGGKSRASQSGAESAALTDAADVVIEVYALPDPDSAGGRLFRIDAIATRDGGLLASLTTDLETDLRDAVTLVPRREGGYRAVFSGAPLGRGLAARTMQALAGHWGG